MAGLACRQRSAWAGDARPDEGFLHDVVRARAVGAEPLDVDVQGLRVAAIQLADRGIGAGRYSHRHERRARHFPAQTVHGATPDPELRLITCRGAFDYATGHYLSNVIVCATQAS
jgi:hypothetical protein